MLEKSRDWSLACHMLTRREETCQLEGTGKVDAVVSYRRNREHRERIRGGASGIVAARVLPKESCNACPKERSTDSELRHIERGENGMQKKDGPARGVKTRWLL